MAWRAYCQGRRVLRGEAARWIAEGRVRVRPDRARPGISDWPAGAADRGRWPAHGRATAPVPDAQQTARVVTTAQDAARDTVYRCFDGAGLPWIAPVGRLDKGSEGLLLFSNDPQWAARLTDPQTGPDKTYHVQVDGLPDDATLAALRAGVEDEGEFAARAVRVLRSGDKTAWLEVVLDEAAPPYPPPVGGLRPAGAAPGPGRDRRAAARRSRQGPVAGPAGQRPAAAGGRCTGLIIARGGVCRAPFQA